METQVFIRKPLRVDAVQVTADNLYDVAKWCAGEVHSNQTNSLPYKFIKVDVLNPTSAKQQEANIGDWVLKSDKGYKVYTAKAFERGFDAFELTMAAQNETVPID